MTNHSPMRPGDEITVKATIDGFAGPHTGTFVRFTHRYRAVCHVTVRGRSMTVLTDPSNVAHYPGEGLTAPALPRETDPDVDLFDREIEQYIDNVCREVYRP
jgi:hypothetical protein